MKLTETEDNIHWARTHTMDQSGQRTDESLFNYRENATTKSRLSRRASDSILTLFPPVHVTHNTLYHVDATRQSIEKILTRIEI